MGGMSKQTGISEDRRGSTLVVSLARPPVNALNAALMQALSQALARAAADPEVRAIVLAAEGAQFSAGLDVSELGKVKGAVLAGLCRQIETLGKPVVAALAGNCLGGAMELVLAAHARVAHTGARLGLPEISLGLLPCAGATQRLPRLTGAQVALKILMEGHPVTAAEALAMGFVDEVGEDAPIKRAVALAERLADEPPRQTIDRRDGMRDPVAYQAAVTAARSKIEGWRMPAYARLVDCVEAALLLPADMGLGFEQVAFEDVATTPEAQGLRHAFVAERRAVFPPSEVAAVAPPRLAAIAVLGAGGAVADVVRQALAAGMKVTLVEPDRAALTEVLGRIAARQEALVAEGQLTQAARDADWARLTGVLAGEGIDAVDLVLTSPDGPRLANNPAPVIGLGGKGALVLHPALLAGGLAEISVTGAVPVAHQAAALAFARRLGWKVMMQGPGASIDQRLRAVLSRSIAHLEGLGQDRATIAATLAAFGLGAGARMKLPSPPANAGDILAFCLAALQNEGAKMVQDGAARRPSDIDAAALLSGLFPRWEGGPMFLADRMGLMALRADLRRRAEAAPRLFTPAPLLDMLIGEGRSFADLNKG